MPVDMYAGILDFSSNTRRYNAAIDSIPMFRKNVTSRILRTKFLYTPPMVER